VTITRWLDEDPYPQAEAELLPDFEWDDGDAELLARANEVVRRALALASEFTESLWSPDVELSGDPVESAWQLAAIAPLGPIDQFSLLRSESVRHLLDGVITLTLAASETLTMAWTDDEAPDAADDEPRDR
jgi:Lon protease-like protein